MKAEILYKYFPMLTEQQKAQFEALGALYGEWNAKINVISRKDIDELYPRHVLHSLAIASFLAQLKEGTTFLDLGTGGGFPGIPLAIFYPECQFLLLDRIAKKLKVASEIAKTIGLTNVEFQHGDAGECHRKFDYVVSRAVMPLDGLVKIAQRNIAHTDIVPGIYPPGLVCLKGGDLKEEIQQTKAKVITEPISKTFKEEFFETKEIVYVPL